MAVKVSYSNRGGGLPSYGSKKLKPLGTTSVQAAPAYSARMLTQAASSQQAPDVLARVINGQQNTFAPSPAPATTAPAANYSAPPNTQATTGAGTTLDMGQLAADPIYAAMVAAQDRRVGNATGARTTGYEQALTRFGDPNLATSTLTNLGLNPSEASTFAQAAQQNPTSTLAQLLTGHQQQVAGLGQGDYGSRLFYSSARANALGQEGQNYLNQQSGAQDALHQMLASLDAQYQAEQQAANDAKSSAAGDAWSRLTAAIQAGQRGGGGAGGDGGAAPITDTGTGAPPSALPNPFPAISNLGTGMQVSSPAGVANWFGGQGILTPTQQAALAMAGTPSNGRVAPDVVSLARALTARGGGNYMG